MAVRIGNALLCLAALLLVSFFALLFLGQAEVAMSFLLAAFVALVGAMVCVAVAHRH